MLKRQKNKGLTIGKVRFFSISIFISTSNFDFLRHQDALKSTFDEDVVDENSVPLNKTYLMAKTMGWTLDNCFSQTFINENGKHFCGDVCMN